MLQIGWVRLPLTLGTFVCGCPAISSWVVMFEFGFAVEQNQEPSVRKVGVTP